MSDDLKPCPFCGGAGAIKYNQGNENNPQKWWCECALCGIVRGRYWGSNSWQHRDEQTKEIDATARCNAIEAWNHRSPAAQADAEDAARYRWLRENSESKPGYADLHAKPRRTHFLMLPVLEGSDLDKLVDSARKKEK